MEDEASTLEPGERAVPVEPRLAAPFGHEPERPGPLPPDEAERDTEPERRDIPRSLALGGENGGAKDRKSVV